MEQLRAIGRWLRGLVLARDVADTADAITGGTAESGPKGLFRNVVDTLLYGGVGLMTVLTEGVQTFAPLSYFVCFLLAVILVPPAARRLTGLFRRSAPLPGPARVTSSPDGLAPLGTEPLGGFPVHMRPVEDKPHIAELRSQIEAVLNEMRRRDEQTSAKLAAFEGPIARGESGFNSVRAVLALRQLRSAERRLKKLVRIVFGDGTPDTNQSVFSYDSAEIFDTNVDEITRSLVDCHLHDASKTRAELREMRQKRHETRSSAQSTGINLSAEKHRDMLSDEATHLQTFITAAKARYMQRCRDPLDRWSEGQ